MILEFMFNDTDFNYEPEYSDFMRELEKLSGADVYNLSDDELNDLSNYWYPNLQLRFYHAALDEFKEKQLYENNKHAFYGVSRSDF